MGLQRIQLQPIYLKRDVLRVLVPRFIEAVPGS